MEPSTFKPHVQLTFTLIVPPEKVDSISEKLFDVAKWFDVFDGGKLEQSDVNYSPHLQ